MATVGRKKKPASLKLVTDTAKKHPKSPLPPINHVRKGLPSPPPELRKRAQQEWEEVVQDLYDCGILATTDRTVLADYCEVVADFWDAAAAMELARKEDETGTFGLLVIGVNGNPVANPLVGMKNRASLTLLRLCAELGMTPSARSRVNSVAREEETDPADKYLVA